MEYKIGNIFKGDKVIWMVFLFLALISIVEVFSASSNLTYKSRNFIMPFIKHSGTMVLGFFVILVTMNIPCRLFKYFTTILLPLSIILLVAVLFVGDTHYEATRQLTILGWSVQPSEIAKGTLILTVALILSSLQREKGADPAAFKYILYVTIPIAFLIMIENLSTAALLCFVVFLMMIIGRVPWKQVGALVGIVGTCVVLLLVAILLIGKEEEEDAEGSKKPAVEIVAGVNAEKQDIGKKGRGGIFHRADTWKSRILKFAKEEKPIPKDFDLDKNGQVGHANIAIVSSGYIGVGPGNSVERDFLAHAFDDFIFAIIIEELGLVGAFIVVMLYMTILFRTAVIARRCENSFPAFLAMGLALMLVVQALFNMCVAVGLVPVTGQPLPLISKGGSSTVINCAYIGVILSISRTAMKRTSTPELVPAVDITGEVSEDVESQYTYADEQL